MQRKAALPGAQVNNTCRQFVAQRKRNVPEKWSRTLAVNSMARQKDNLVTIGLVGAITETLRVFGVGSKEYERVVAAPVSTKPLRRNDVRGVINRIKGDYKRGYIVTGLIDDSVYDEDCYFADPTISFKGLRLWQRNLQLLVPFLVSPSLNLTSISRLGRDKEGREMIRAEWSLSTYLSLPWRPFIDILGWTDYTLNESANKVVSHVESWNVSGTEALLQIVRPTAGPSSS